MKRFEAKRKLTALIVGGILAAVVGIVSCSTAADDNSPQSVTPAGESRTFVAFDNTRGVCTVIVYDDYRRRDIDIIEVVRAGVSSEPRKWTAYDSCPFYFSYQFAVPGAEENTVIYTPRDVSANQVAVRIDADKTTTIPIPKLEETLSAQNELLSAQSYLIVQNNSSYSFQLQRGSSLITPENIGGAVVNAGERALYKIAGGATASAYKLLVGANNVLFPANPATFVAGHVYQFVYTGSGVAAAAQGGDIQLDVVTVTAQGAEGVDIPAAPAGLAVAAVTTDAVSLSWSAASGVSGYRIYRSTSADGAFYQIGSRSAAGAQSPAYTDTGLNADTAYYYKVSAVNAAGESAQTAAVEGKTSEPSLPPATPAGLTVTGVAPNSVDLSWTAASRAGSYKIYRAASAGGTFTQVGISAVSYCTDSGLSPNTAYYYKVSAVNAIGESEQSAAVEGRTDRLTVTELNLSGAVTAPVKDAVPQAQATALSHSQYTITSFTWQTASGGAASGAFAAGTVYKAVFGLQAQGVYTFAGLGADAFTFSGATSVTATVNGQAATVTVTFPATQPEVALSAATADEFVTRLNWIKGNGVPDMNYVITLTANISIAPYTLNAGVSSMLRNTIVKIAGSGGERTITLNANGSLFTLEGYNTTNKFTFVVGENIKLQGKSSNTASVVKVNQYAEFIMRGGTISGNTASSSFGGGVYVNNGTFTMSGGTISGNIASSSSSYSYGGGVYVDNGTFTMSGGTISGNTASSSSSYSYGGGVYVSSSGTFMMMGGTISGNNSYYGGGGVYVYDGTFTMTGGTISGNTTSSFGGGVYVGSGTFTKSGNSIIYGNDAYDTSLKNTVSGNGRAVYVNSGKKRNATAYASDTMDSNLSGYAGGWE
jgi:hypothetical protein